MARESGDNNATGAESRKRGKGEQGQRGDAHLAENVGHGSPRRAGRV